MLFFLCCFFPAANEVKGQALKGLAMNKIVEGNNTFAADLYARLVETSKSNLFFSPNSIYNALGMTYLGARGRTAREITAVLHVDINQKLVAPAFEKLIQKLKAPRMVVVE